MVSCCICYLHLCCNVRFESSDFSLQTRRDSRLRILRIKGSTAKLWHMAKLAHVVAVFPVGDDGKDVKVSPYIQLNDILKPCHLDLLRRADQWRSRLKITPLEPGLAIIPAYLDSWLYS